MEAHLETLLERPPRPFASERFAPDEWVALFEGATRHGLLGALAERLPHDAGLPPGFRERLRHRLVAMRFQASLLRTALDEALRALERERIPVAALKGPVLAERLYADPTSRPSHDLDLLVAEGDFDRAAAALEALGYELDRSPVGRYQRQHLHHVPLVRRGGFAIELHFRGLTAFSDILRGEQLLARARPYRTASGAPALVLSPEDELLYLCLHAAGHLFERLGWMYDIVLLIEKNPDLDWLAVASSARAVGMLSGLDFALIHLRRLGVPIPPELPTHLGPCRSRWAEWTRQRALTTQKGPLFQGLFIAYHTVLCDDPWVAGRRLLHHAVWFLRRRAYRTLRALRARP